VERFGPTRRGGPVFRWLGEPLALDFANTVMVVRGAKTVDLLATPSELESWLAAESDRLGESRSALRHIDEVLALRDAVRDVFSAVASSEPVPAAATRRLNATSRAAPVARRLQTAADGALAITDAPAGGDALDRLLGSLARSAMELATYDRDQLKLCAAPSCGMFFLGSRRWCCPACGNRARVARHYERTRARGVSS
jgi:predicted RNA-binding Zn ribbon-like protein